MTESKDFLNDKRKFSIEQRDGTTKVYYLNAPTADDIRQADWEHAKTYNRALKEGVLTTSEMMTILEDRNIAGPDYDRIAEDLNVQMTQKVIAMEQEKDEEERYKLALEVRAIRDDIFKWNNRVSGPLSATCENMANEARVEYLTSSVIQNEEGHKVWPTFDDYKSEKDITLQFKAKFEVMLWLEGLESDVLENTPETKVLRSKLDKVVADLNAEGEKLEKELSEEVEESSAPDVKKKRARKKHVQ